MSIRMQSLGDSFQYINSCLFNLITYIAKRNSAERLAYFLWKERMNAMV